MNKKGADHNLAVRLAYLRGRIDADQVHDGGRALHPNYASMATANGVSPADPVLAPCRRCHLRYDAEHHRTNARATRRARSSTPDLFAEMEATGVARTMPASADENAAVMPPQMRTQTLR